MAVSKSFFLRRKGVVGSLQMARMNGQQITKDKVSTYHDAQTRAQLVQRMCMATATAFYKEGKDVLSWSVEGARNTNEAMHFLYNKNVAILRDLAKDNKGVFKYKNIEYLVPTSGYISPLFVSYGSLPTLKHTRTIFNICENSVWQIEAGDSVIICGWQAPLETSNKRNFVWYKVDFLQKPSENFFENINLNEAYQRLGQVVKLSFSENNRINKDNYIVSVNTNGTLRLSIRGVQDRYAVIRMRKVTGVMKYSTETITQPAKEHPNFTEALKTYGVPRDEILNGE